MGYFLELMTRRRRGEDFDAGPLSRPPKGGTGAILVGGVLIAAGFVGYGVYAMHSGKTWIPTYGRGSSVHLEGAAGTRLAIAYIALGVALHFHYFWGLTPKLWNFAHLGKIVALLVFIWALFTALGLHLI